MRVRQDSVRVLDEELKNQQQSFNAGIVGKLNVQRADVALANEQPELYNAETQLKDSYLRLGDLFGLEAHPGAAPPFEISGELQYQPNHPDLNDCLARADASRAVIKARQKDIEIEDQQYILDRSAMRPHVQAFSGYEVYSERDPAVGPEFNYGYVVGINATWGVSKIPIRLRGLLSTDHFVVAWDWRHYLWAVLLAMISVFIASYAPARRAARLPPVVTLRGSSV